MDAGEQDCGKMAPKIKRVELELLEVHLDTGRTSLGAGWHAQHMPPSQLTQLGEAGRGQRVVAGVDNLLSFTDNLKTHNSTHHYVTDLTSVATEDNELPL